MSFKRMLEDLEVLMDWEEDEGDEVGNIEEGVSTGAVKMVVETMLEAPRVKSMFKRLGIDLTQAGVSESLYAALEPAVMVFLGEQGTHVAGMSKAKTAMRGMAKGKMEGEEVEGERLEEASGRQSNYVAIGKDAYGAMDVVKMAIKNADKMFGASSGPEDIWGGFSNLAAALSYMEDAFDMAKRDYKEAAIAQKSVSKAAKDIQGLSNTMRQQGYGESTEAVDIDKDKEGCEEINDAKLEAALNALYPHK